MSADVASVLAAAESLPAEQRRESVELLAAGLDDEIVPPLSEAWRREIAARLADYDAGRVTAKPWAEVRASLAARRSARG